MLSLRQNILLCISHRKKCIFDLDLPTLFLFLLIQHSFEISSDNMAQIMDENADNNLEKLIVQQCKYFAEFFVKHFEEKQEAYYNETMNLSGKSHQPLKVLEPAAAGFRGGSGAAGGVGLAGVAIGSQLASGFGIAASVTTTIEKVGNFISNYKHKDKADKISDVLCQGEEKSVVRAILITFATNLYKQYEDVFAKLTENKNWRILLRKLARDAVDRIMNYIYIYKTNQPDETLVVEQKLLQKAFDNGSSKGYFGNKIQKHDIPFMKSDWTFSKLNEKVGLIKNIDNKYHFYRKPNRKYFLRNNEDDFGYRLLPDNINVSKFYEEVDEEVKCIDVLTVELINDLIEQVKEKLEKDDAKRKSERLENNQHEIKENLQMLFEKVEQLHRSESKDQERIRFNVIEPVKYFTGREELLENIHTAFMNNTNHQTDISQTVSLTGPAGVGKTELARMYANKYKEFYQENIIWINSENIQTLRRSFQNLARKLHIPLSDKFQQNEREQIRNMTHIIEEVYKRISIDKCLIIFDNAEDFKDIEDFLPSSKYSYNERPFTLLTSRNNDWNIDESGHIEIIPVNIFTDNEAIQFIKETLNIKNDKYDKQIIDLINLLQKLPLALQQAVSYIDEKSKLCKLSNTNCFDIQDYINEFKEKSNKLLNFRKSTNRYLDTLYTTWEVTMNKIKKLEDGSLALEILELISYFAPDYINFITCFRGFIKNDEKLCNVIDILQKYSLICIKNGEANIHRLNQEVIRQQLKEKNLEMETIKKAVRLVIDWQGNNENHILSILNYASFYGQLVDEFYSLNFDILTTSLQLFAKYGCNVEEISKVELLLEKGAKLEGNLNGHAPIYLAAERDNVEILKLLIKKGANIQCEDKDGWSPLHCACFNGNKEIVKILLRNEANVNSADMEGWTSLHSASFVGYFDIIKLLISYGANVNKVDKSGLSALHCAASNGHVDIVKYLIAKGANVTICDEIGRIPLHRAALHGHLNIVKILVNHGADVKCANKLGWTVLHNATQSGNFEVVKFLVENGADVQCVDNQGWSPLRTATKFDYQDITKYLISKGTSVDITDKYGCTPLHTIVRNGNYNMCKLLIEEGADVNHPDIDGWTPLHNAAQRGHFSIVQLLVENQANINAIDKNGCTPLHSLARTGQLNIVNYLLSKNADILAKNNDEQTPIDIAKENKHHQLVELLTEKL